MADLNTLDPHLAPWAKWLYRGGKQYDGRLIVTSAYRSLSKQARLRAAWEAGESKIPAAKPGNSLHNFGLAFDLARLGVNPFEDPLLPWLGSIWEKVGGRYGGVRDPVHFDVRI